MVSIHCRREIAKHGVTRLPFFSIDTISTPPLVAVKAIEVCAARRHMPTCGDWLDADVPSSSIACDRVLGWQQKSMLHTVHYPVLSAGQVPCTLGRGTGVVRLLAVLSTGVQLGIAPLELLKVRVQRGTKYCKYRYTQYTG